jgi:hypothetical protein
MVVAQNGETKVVLQDIASHEATHERLALLKLLAMARGEIAGGQVEPLAGLKDRMRAPRGDEAVKDLAPLKPPSSSPPAAGSAARS